MRQVLINLLVKRNNLLFHETKRFAGHSKWANIKHDKGVADQKKADNFRKLVNRMRLAIRDNGGQNDPADNPALAQVIEQAKKNNMPATTIKRALNEKEEEGEKIIAEVLGISDIRVIVHIQSTNAILARNTLQTMMKKIKAKVMHDNSVIKHFDPSHTIICKKDCTLDQATEDAIKADAENVDEVEKENIKYFEFTCEPAYAYKCEKMLLEMEYDVLFSDITYIPRRPIESTPARQEAIDLIRKKAMTQSFVKRVEDNIEESV